MSEFFREFFRARRLYEDEALSALAEKTTQKACGVFNVLESKLDPQRLRDLNEQAISRYEMLLRKEQRAEATIKSHLRHLKAALRWAAENRLIPTAPKVRMPKRARKAKAMRGRPITLEELERMIEKISGTLYPNGRFSPKQNEETVASWERLLWGLWWSGLRIGEALSMHWEDDAKIYPVELDGREPMLLIPAELEKGHTDRLLPMAPEFAEFLRETPPAERSG